MLTDIRLSAMTTKHYPELDANPNFAKLEEGILDFWKRERVFERSVEARPEKKADGSTNAYVFYDGPPFANGLPHYGHLLTGYVKDAIARYHTMKGARVERRFGWDCHGLPAEMGAEKELNITGRAAIIEYGIDKFNEYCRNNVMRYVADWEYYVTRQGRWVDFKNDYKTMDKDFMESVIWAFSELHKKGLVYEAFRVMPYSWAAETPLSNFETRMDNATREREDKAAYVKFRLRDVPDDMPRKVPLYLVAWTTTPWTLPSNLALAVKKESLNYLYYKKDGELVIAAESARQKLESWGYEVAKNKDITNSAPQIHHDSEEEAPALLGEDLLDLTYEPLFPYFKDTPNAFRVIDGGDAVTEGEGTGVIHMAPGFGEVDQKVCAENGIEVIVPVDGQGKFTDAIYDIPWLCHTERSEGSMHGKDSSAEPQNDMLKLSGLIVVPDTRIAESDITISEEDKAQHIAAKDVAKYGLANMRILRWLKANNKLVKDEPYKHNYPHCWRTDTPIIYRAMSSWYVAVTKFRDRAGEINQQINWIPNHVRNGQMGHMLATAPDWSISRNRFWGTPIPIWRSPSGKVIVPSSIAEIEAWSGKKIDDLHRPMIDEVTFTKDGETFTRVEDVFDCWFESGSMPYAQLHYPFANKQQFEENFPAQFITEYVGQTRGWFNTLIMLSTALFDKPPFENCICHGVVIDEETGLKYSKRLKNYKDPKEVMDAYGADALRWMMLASPVMRGADLGVDPDGKFIRDVVRLNIKPLWSAFNFFTLYANADGIEAHYVASSRPSEARAGIPIHMAEAETTSDLGSGARREIPVLPSANRDDEHTNILDRYILAKAKAAITQVQASLDAYDTPGAAEAITGFFEVLNNWYIRRSRPRFWDEVMTTDKQAAYDTLFTVLSLMCRAAAPLLPFTTEAIYRGLNGDSASVHLTDFPDVNRIADESELVADMDWARDVCNAAASVRNRQNIRNRQPLDSLTIHGHNPLLQRNFDKEDSEALIRWNQFKEIIEEEINVKKVQMSGFLMPEEFKRVAVYKLQIIAPVLGKRIPEKMKQIIPASKKGDWKKLSDGTIEIAGEKLLPGEYIQTLEPTAEYKDCAAALSTYDNTMVTLDLTITPELEAEGRARDLVRMIQQARKDAGFNVGDRITLAVDVPADFKAAIAAHGEYIKEQTLAVKLEEGAAKATQQVTQELDGETFIIGLSKVA